MLDGGGDAVPHHYRHFCPLDKINSNTLYFNYGILLYISDRSEKISMFYHKRFQAYDKEGWFFSRQFLEHKRA
jgi:hypothetical protein